MGVLSLGPYALGEMGRELVPSPTPFSIFLLPPELDFCPKIDVRYVSTQKLLCAAS